MVYRQAGARLTITRVVDLNPWAPRPVSQVTVPRMASLFKFISTTKVTPTVSGHGV